MRPGVRTGAPGCWPLRGEAGPQRKALPPIPCRWGSWGPTAGSHCPSVCVSELWGRTQGTTCLFSAGNNESVPELSRKVQRHQCGFCLFPPLRSIFRARRGGGGIKPVLSFFRPRTLVQMHPALCAAPGGPTPGYGPPPSSLREMPVPLLSPARGCAPWVHMAGAQLPLSPPQLWEPGARICLPLLLVSGIQSHQLLDSCSCSQFSFPPA